MIYIFTSFINEERKIFDFLHKNAFTVIAQLVTRVFNFSDVCAKDLLKKTNSRAKRVCRLAVEKKNAEKTKATEPTKFHLKNDNDRNAVCHRKDYGPMFGYMGGSHGIAIYSNCNSSNSSFAKFPNAYNDTTREEMSIFSSDTDTEGFKVQEIEVFRVNI